MPALIRRPRPMTSGEAGGKHRMIVTWLTAVPVATLAMLYLIATGRWGSYLTIPDAPFYIGDIGVALAAVQVAVALSTRRATARDLARSPLLLVLVIALIGYSTVRLAVELDFSLVALRDFAPYGYAVVAVLAFLLPARDERFWRPLIYATLLFHFLWVVVLFRAPGYPWELPVLGRDAMIFVKRPDFDATILGVGAAFALREILLRRRSLGWVQLVALAVFAVVSAAGMLTISTRAGLLAGLAALGTVTLTLPRRSSGKVRRRRTTWLVRLVAVLLGAALLAAAIALTPAGNRLVDGFSNTSSASGTVSARQDVLIRVTHYVLNDPDRTAIGVGFGPDFLHYSGAWSSLEGIYQNVRSPHNYVLGTLARLGVAGALIICFIIGLGWWLAWSTLRKDVQPASVLAALLAISLPLVSMLGVVLESPFGAIPYFWALGQLAVRRVAAPPSAGR